MSTDTVLFRCSGHRMLMLRRPERESCALAAALALGLVASLDAKTFQKRRVSSAAA